MLHTYISIIMFNSNLQLQHTTKVTLYYLVVLTYHVNTNDINMPRKNKRMEAMSILCIYRNVRYQTENIELTCINHNIR